MKYLLRIAVTALALSPVFAASSAKADRIYNFPRVAGAILDHCWSWATNCGWARAHWYCQRRGHPRARSFSRYRPGRTYVVGSGRYCTGTGCVGYRSIRCVAGGGGGGGVGDKARFCRTYAQNAVSQQRINQARRCGGWGFRWHTNFRNHYNWCMSASNHRARAEDNARRVRLRRCGAGGGGATCNDTRPVCGQWRGRRYNFRDICQLRRRGARFIRYGRCGGGGGGGGACN